MSELHIKLKNKTVEILFQRHIDSETLFEKSTNKSAKVRYIKPAIPVILQMSTFAKVKMLIQPGISSITVAAATVSVVVVVVVVVVAEAAVD